MVESYKDLEEEDIPGLSREQIESFRTEAIEAKHSIDVQLARRRADIDSRKDSRGRVPQEEFNEYRTWRASALGAKRKVEVVLRLLKEEDSKRSDVKKPAVEEGRVWAMFASNCQEQPRYAAQHADELLAEYKKRFGKEK